MGKLPVLCVFLLVTFPIFTGATEQERVNQRFYRLAHELGPHLTEGKAEYGILYLPIKGSRELLHHNQQALDNANYYREAKVANYPMVKGNTEDAKFGDIFSNYAIVVPQSFRGSKIMIHAEAQLLESVLPKMLEWIRKTYNQRPTKVYLYSFYLPCKVCGKLVSDFIKSNRLLPLTLGYSSTDWNYEKEGADQVHRTLALLREAAKRIQKSKIYYLEKLKDFPIGKLRNGKGRGRRDLLAINQDTNLRCLHLFLSLNFSNGRPVTEFDDYGNATITLYDVKGQVKSVITTVGARERQLDDSYLSEGDYAVMSSICNETNPINCRPSEVRTAAWANCKDNWLTAKVLPAYNYTAQMLVQLFDGAPRVTMRYLDVRNTYTTINDFVVVKPLDEHHEALRIPITSFEINEADNRVRFKQLKRLDNRMSNGFTVKYVSGDIGPVFDNTEKIEIQWTPEDCFVEGHSDENEYPFVVETKDEIVKFLIPALCCVGVTFILVLLVWVVKEVTRRSARYPIKNVI